MAEIRASDRESIEKALRRFKRLVRIEEIIKGSRKPILYLKPRNRRRSKSAPSRKPDR